MQMPMQKYLFYGNYLTAETEMRQFTASNDFYYILQLANVFSDLI